MTDQRQSSGRAQEYQERKLTKPPMAHRIKKPFKYVPSHETNIARTYSRVQDALKEEAKAAEEEAKAARAAEEINVRPLARKEKKAA